MADTGLVVIYSWHLLNSSFVKNWTIVFFLFHMKNYLNFKVQTSQFLCALVSKTQGSCGLLNWSGTRQSTCRGPIPKTICDSKTRSHSCSSSKRWWLPHSSEWWFVGWCMQGTRIKMMVHILMKTANPLWTLLQKQLLKCWLSHDASAAKREQGQHYCHCYWCEITKEAQGKILTCS